MFTTYLFKVPEITKRHVPEERKPVPVRKEAPPAKGTSSTQVKKKIKNLTIFQYIFVSCLECFHESAVYVPFILPDLLFCFVLYLSLQCLNVSVLALLFPNDLVFVCCVCFDCVFFADKSWVFFLLECHEKQ